MNLTPEQRTRLVALLSAGRALTAAEQTDLLNLQSIAMNSGELTSILTSVQMPASQVNPIAAAASAQQQQSLQPVNPPAQVVPVAQQQQQQPESAAPAAESQQQTESGETPGQPEAQAQLENLGLVDRARAVFNSNAGLIQRNSQLAQENGELRERVAQAEASATETGQQLAIAQQQLGALQLGLTQAQQQTVEAQQQIQTTAEATTDALASVGIPESSLPSPSRVTTPGTPEAVPTTEAELEEALKELDTHVERKALIAQFRKAQQSAVILN